MTKTSIFALLLVVGGFFSSLLAAEDILIMNFEDGTYGDWKVEGDAFGTKPFKKVFNKYRPDDDVGSWHANSYMRGDSKSEAPKGSLTSPAFTIERDYINLAIAGSPRTKDAGFKVLVEGKVVAKISGIKGNTLADTNIDVKAYKGKSAVVVIYDECDGWWGHILVDDIRQSDQKAGYEAASKEIKVTQKLILLPMTRSKVPARKLSITVDGILIHNVTTALANSKDDVAWWAYLDMSDMVGKTATIDVEVKIGGSTLEMIEFADEPRTAENVYDEEERPQLRFSQLTGWNNDPNGLTYYDGHYHLFWQCNPVGTGWSNMYWGHAKSPDLINWTEMPRALRGGGGRGVPLEKRHPSMGVATCFSGGASVDTKNTAGWKTGKDDVMVLFYADMNLGPSIAYSTDGGVRFQRYEKNPVTSSGRDNKLFWYEPGKHWVAAGFAKGQINIWNSKNLKDWKEASVFKHKPKNKKGFYECPELIELAVDGDENNKKWVIFCAIPSYLIGSFDGKTFTPDSREDDISIFGKMSAGQCFSNTPDGRKILVGWAHIPTKKAPFNMGFTLPLNLTLRTVKNGKIRMFANPVKELEKLRKDPEIALSNIELNSSSKSITKKLSNELYDICVTFEKKGNPKSADIVMGKTKITYDFEKETVGEKSVPLIDGKVTLRIIVDRPYLEVIAGDGYMYNIDHNKNMGNKPSKLTVTADGPAGSSVVIESLKVYPMKSIWRNK